MFCYIFIIIFLLHLTFGTFQRYFIKLADSFLSMLSLQRHSPLLVVFSSLAVFACITHVFLHVVHFNIRVLSILITVVLFPV